MLIQCINKLNIGLPKAELQLSQDQYKLGSTINGDIVIKGGLIKNILKRYEIELVKESDIDEEHTMLNSRSVYCSKECRPYKKETVPFNMNVPEDVMNHLGSNRYSLIVRMVLVNSQTVIHKQPINIITEPHTI